MLDNSVFGRFLRFLHKTSEEISLRIPQRFGPHFDGLYIGRLPNLHQLLELVPAVLSVLVRMVMEELEDIEPDRW